MVHQFQFVPHFRPKPYKLLEKKKKKKKKGAFHLVGIN